MVEQLDSMANSATRAAPLHSSLAKDRQRRRSQRCNWTEEMETKLVEMRRNGATWKSIAEELQIKRWQSVQMHYLRNLRDKESEEDEAKISELKGVIRADWETRYRRLADASGLDENRVKKLLYNMRPSWRSRYIDSENTIEPYLKYLDDDLEESGRAGHAPEGQVPDEKNMFAALATQPWTTVAPFPYAPHALSYWPYCGSYVPAQMAAQMATPPIMRPHGYLSPESSSREAKDAAKDGLPETPSRVGSRRQRMIQNIDSYLSCGADDN